MIEKVLVVGGSGMLGVPVVKKLDEAGYMVSVMSTNPEKAEKKFDEKIKIVEGDVTDFDSLMIGFENFDAVHLNLNSSLDPKKYEEIEIGGTANASRAAKERQLKRITMISGSSSKGIERGIIYLDAKVRAEKSVINSGVPFTAFRPSWFFETLPHFIQNSKATILGDQPMKINWLSADDYATQVLNAYKSDEAINKCFYNFGPEKMTMIEALTKYCKVFHPNIKPEIISFFKAKLISKLPKMAKLKLAIPFFEYFSKNDEDVDSSDTDRILGKNLTTLDEWMKKIKTN